MARVFEPVSQILALFNLRHGSMFLIMHILDESEVQSLRRFSSTCNSAFKVASW